MFIVPLYYKEYSLDKITYLKIQNNFSNKPYEVRRWYLWSYIIHNLKMSRGDEKF